MLTPALKKCKRRASGHVKIQQRLCGKKVRVVCVDPDATESSSDDDDDGGGGGEASGERSSARKKLIREVYLPPQYCLPPSRDGEASCFSVFTHEFLPPPRNPADQASSSIRKPWPQKRDACEARKNATPFHPARSYLSRRKRSSNVRKQSKYRGVRQRKWGKWAAEIWDPVKGIRVWLGTYNTADEAATAYNEAAMQISGIHANANFPYSESSSCEKPLSISTPCTSSQGQNSGARCQASHQEDNSSEVQCCMASVCVGDSSSGCLSIASAYLEKLLEDSELNEAVGSVNDTGSSSSVCLDDDYGFRPLDDDVFIRSLQCNHDADLFSDDGKEPLILVEACTVENNQKGSSSVDADNQQTSVPLLNVRHPSLFVEDFLPELSHIFDTRDSENSEHGKDAVCLLNSLELLEDVNEVSFELDPEALAWIDIPEICGF